MTYITTDTGHLLSFTSTGFFFEAPDFLCRENASLILMESKVILAHLDKE